MPNIQTQCPNCRQPIVANITQVFDTNQDPNAKMKLLSGSENIITCQNCGYQGPLPVPIVYHDKDKELLLTFFPPDLGQTMEEQQKRIGPLIQKIMDNLPQEERKGYLLNPQNVLTQRGLVERILEADGITKEMLDAQENRMKLIQQLISTSEDSIQQVIDEHDDQIDNELFQSLSTLIETSMIQGDQESALVLERLRNNILEHSTLGKEVQDQVNEFELAAEILQKEGRNLTRENLLELVLQAPAEARINAYVQLARPGFDYEFFQLLSDRIDKARGDGRARLIDLRDNILEITERIDEEIEARTEIARRNLNSVIEAPNTRQVLEQNLRAIDDLFIQIAESELKLARQNNDLERASKIQEILTILAELSKPSEEIQLLNDLMRFEGTEEEFNAMLDERSDEFTDEFVQTITGLMGQISAQEDAEEDEEDPSYERIQSIYQYAIKKSMQKKFKGS